MFSFRGTGSTSVATHLLPHTSPTPSPLQVQAQLKARLEQGHYHMWNGVLQTAIVRLIDDALPPLREWNEQTGGREHLEDLASLFCVPLEPPMEGPQTFHAPRPLDAHVLCPCNMGSRRDGLLVSGHMASPQPCVRVPALSRPPRRL